ncbi:MAG: hypothetical protein KME35_17355 [Aphanocapsa sp. GSE-SYN-MK-11-07L]|jgi:hypothetical protein|nr:hypothetical protein [Aphanocapsa sp. GSE-SYN-MK-11-07L]
MSQNRFSPGSIPSIEALNREIDDLYREVEELHHETAMLQGVMAGSCAYFIHQLVLGHQSQQGLSPEQCQQLVIDALKRIRSSQNRFEYDFLTDIEAVLDKMHLSNALKDYSDLI